MTISTEPMSAQNGAIETLRQEERAGVGVRAHIGSSWGFSATTELSTRGPHKTGGQAAMTSRASPRVPGPPLDLPPVAVVTDHWESSCLEDPLLVPLSEKGDLLTALTTAARGDTASSAGKPLRRHLLAGPLPIGDASMGSPLMQVTADATLPGALGSFAYEDEGTLAHSVDIVRDGTWWVGVLSSRDTAALAGVPNGGRPRRRP